MRVNFKEQKFDNTLGSLLHNNLRPKNSVSFKAAPFSQFKSQTQFILSTFPQNTTTLSNQSEQLNFKKNIIFKTLAVVGGMVAIGIGIIAVALKFKKGAKPPIDEGIELLKSQYQKLTTQFPDDKIYYEKLAKKIGLQNGEEFKLNSIVGASQLKKLLNVFTPKDFRVGQNFDGVRDCTYRVNLHNHTQASDGKLSVFEILEQARKWADRVALKVGDDNKPPFTIAITDHDTLDGAKEAVKIIAQNPAKYKNLRLVLGSEISVSHLDPKDVIKPVDFELIGYSLNPFDTSLNKLLNDLQISRTKGISQLLADCKKLYPNVDFNIEDTKFFHSNLKNVRTNGTIDLGCEYLEHKVRFSGFVEQINQYVLPQGAEKLDIATIFRQLGDDFYMQKDAKKIAHIASLDEISTYYKNVLAKILKEKNIKFNPQKFDEIFEKPFDRSRIIELKKNSLPAIGDKKGIIIEPKEVFDAVKQGNNQGFFGVAHPGFLSFDKKYSENVLNNYTKDDINDAGLRLIKRLFESLKRKGNDLFLTSEFNYDSYPLGKGNQDWNNRIRDFILEKTNMNLLNTGGVDAHKPSIFTKHLCVEDGYVKELDLQKILGEKHESFARHFG